MDTSGFRITCANKNQNGTIVRLGGRDWSMEVHDALHRIVTNTLKLHIIIGNDLFYIGVRGEGDEIYPVTEPDGKPLDEIDGLTSC